MKAWVLHKNRDVRLQEIPIPAPKNDEVLVQVKAAGICSSDIPRVFSGGAYHYPIVLGHEFSGVTEDGRCVAVFPLLPCHKCDSCLSEHYETCTNYSYIGSRQNGAFAEYVAVPKWNLIDLPDTITFEQAALIEPAAVALHAKKSINDFGISKAAVVGNGVIGRLIGAWLTHYGVQIVDILGRNQSNLCLQYDVCFEAVGTSESFRRCIELVKPNGEIILVGNPNVDFCIDQKLYWQILRKQIGIKGVWNSRYPYDWNHVIEYADKIKLDRFISHRFGFAELDNALDLMYNKREKYGKVIIPL